MAHSAPTTGTRLTVGSFIRFVERYTAALYLVALLAVFAIAAPHAFTVGSATTVIQLSIPLIAIAIGMTFCLVCGEVDLSVAGVAGLSSTVVALLISAGTSWPLAVTLALLLGVGIGLVNGIFTATLVPVFSRFPSFLVTLAMLSATVGIAQSIQPLQQAVAINDVGFQSAFRFSSNVLTSNTTWYVVAVIVFAHLVLSRSRLGYAAYAVGTSSRAAKYVGYNVIRMKFTVMVVSGLLAALGGVLMAGFVQAGFSTIAWGVEIDAIAAAVIGGAALTGGRGSVIGTVWGVLIIGLLNAGLLILQVSSNVQLITKGALVILALVIGEFIRQQATFAR